MSDEGDGYGTVPMFEVPPKYRPPKRKIDYPLWRDYKGKRTSCDDCIRAIAKGERRFVSEPASAVRDDEHGREFYCTRHAIDRKQRDGK